ncbi:DNA repair helicase XPB [Paenibacillus sp. GCM10027627]|uniref:DNA repair helicase XPB n=1 Tax=unclassified Paenibacillus TaxID=185978 RepID=UPI00362DD515
MVRDLERGALIIQSDLTILLDERKKAAADARAQLQAFAEAVKQAGVIHTYRITPLTLWNALASGWTGERVLQALKDYARYEIPLQAEAAIQEWSGRYGKLELLIRDELLLLRGDEETLAALSGNSTISSWLRERISAGEWILAPQSRGLIKQQLTRMGYPVMDKAGYHEGEALAVELRERTASGRAFALRDYQSEAADRFARDGDASGGSGVVVLPCGTGKTIVGIAALAKLGAAALILTSSKTSAQQWKDELLDKTTLTEAEVSIHSGGKGAVKPVTIATYNLLTYRKSKEEHFLHMGLFSERDWGLIIYDEVHLLPAPVFRMTASIQATRRLGLTATLVREDGCAEDVYSLIGPKQFEMPWKAAESESYIATVACTEIRVPLSSGLEQAYGEATPRARLRIAAENEGKLPIVEKLLHCHKGKPTLIIGQYLSQLKRVACEFKAPLLTGETPQEERLKLYEAFKEGACPVLVVSKVANLAIDLPDAAVAIQLSGSFGSRQEEAQRVGRLLRPKGGDNEAWFYSLVTDGTKETEFALKRQLFMLEQGYEYGRQAAGDWVDG